MTKPLPDPHRINADQLRRVGIALYGPSWQRALGQRLNYHNRTLSRWATGKGPLPRRLADDLLRLCADRRAELHVVAQELLAHKAQCLDSRKPRA
jgi:hypothetical protein